MCVCWDVSICYLIGETQHSASVGLTFYNNQLSLNTWSMLWAFPPALQTKRYELYMILSFLARVSVSGFGNALDTEKTGLHFVNDTAGFCPSLLSGKR